MLTQRVIAWVLALPDADAAGVVCGNGLVEVAVVHDARDGGGVRHGGAGAGGGQLPHLQRPGEGAGVKRFMRSRGGAEDLMP